MSPHWLALALALSAVTASACALDRAGEELLIERDPPAVDASAPHASGFDASGPVDPAIDSGIDVSASHVPRDRPIDWALRQVRPPPPGRGKLARQPIVLTLVTV